VPAPKIFKNQSRVGLILEQSAKNQQGIGEMQTIEKRKLIT
jgi:hypothetical protein